jgi:hypothetical protein
MIEELAAWLGQSLHRASTIDGARRALTELPDNVLRDIGIARNEIPFVAGAFAPNDEDGHSAASRTLDRDADEQSATVARGEPGLAARLALAAAIAVSAFVIVSRAVLAEGASDAGGGGRGTRF